MRYVINDNVDLEPFLGHQNITDTYSEEREKKIFVSFPSSMSHLTPMSKIVSTECKLEI